MAFLASTHCMPGLPKLIQKPLQTRASTGDRRHQLALDQHDPIPVVLRPEQGWSLWGGPDASGLVEDSRICDQDLRPTRASNNN